ncbi:MAG: hypothetical protein KGJ66_09905 [Alphaproteobacteria bacterium]|nr:hypothetical protein [Alphaproteobacteria bacterium]
MWKPKGKDFKSISDFNSEWADRIAYLILLGLAVDVGALFIADKCWYRAAIIFANFLIAGGIFGELKFAKRARDADDSRVADAEKATEEAKLETQRLKATFSWRTIESVPFTELQTKLRSDPGSVLISCATGDFESKSYALWLSLAFRQAGWDVKFREATFPGLIRWGVIFPQSEITIRRAFEAAGIEFTLGDIPGSHGFEVTWPGGVQVPPVHQLYVGPMRRYGPPTE